MYLCDEGETMHKKKSGASTLVVAAYCFWLTSAIIDIDSAYCFRLASAISRFS